jgi:hypothetical protein
MSRFLKYAFKFALFLLVQVYVLNKIPPLHRFIVPYLYFLYILWLPFDMKRFWLMVVACVYGLSLDYFTHTPGLHAAACVLIAYLRPFVINLLITREMSEMNYEAPSPKSMGLTQYMFYIVVLTLFHHSYLVFLEWMDFGSFLYFLGKVLASTVISLLLISITEMLFVRKLRYKTNTA